MTNKAFSSQDINRAADFGEKYLFYGSQLSFLRWPYSTTDNYCTGFKRFFFLEFDFLNTNSFRFVSYRIRLKMLKKIKAWPLF